MNRELSHRLARGVVAAALGCGAVAAQAVPTCALHLPSNVGLSSVSCTYDATTTTITIDETYSSVGAGSILFSGLVSGTDYKVKKVIRNNSGTDFGRIANELLDPRSNNDGDDVLPYPSFVPIGFTTSHDGDGLSFAQTAIPSIPRTSDVFNSVFVDELTDVRDFLDFFDGTLANGGVGTLFFGLTNNSSDSTFLLYQRPNEQSVPEPGSLLLASLALLGLGAARRRKA